MASTPPALLYRGRPYQAGESIWRGLTIRSESVLPFAYTRCRSATSAVSACSNVRERKLGLLDQLVRKREQRGRHGETERLSDLDVDDQLELSRLLDGEVGGLSTLQDLVHQGGSPPQEEDDARPVRH